MHRTKRRKGINAGMTLDTFVHWLATTRGSIALHESQYMYVIVESVHVFTLALFVGFSALLDLRLVGVVMPHVRVSRVVSRLMPWTVFGFVVMVISGALLFYAIPVRTYHSIFFRAKAVMLLLAGINAWVFHAGIWRRVMTWDTDPVPPRFARVAGAASLALWMCVIFAGRLIAYNWFDCGIAQTQTVLWLSGCTGEK